MKSNRTDLGNMTIALSQLPTTELEPLTTGNTRNVLPHKT